MNFFSFRSLLVAVTAWAVASGPSALAFPPAPPAVVYGVIRNELGDPLRDPTALVIFEYGVDAKLSTTVVPQLGPAKNYSISIPIDSGITSDLYRPTALMPAAPFRVKVQIGKVVFVPIEMQGALPQIGSPGSKVRLDLTLGVSSANDGLPDTWKRAVAQRFGISAGSIRPGDLAPGTGLTFQQLYVAGTYFMSAQDGFALKMDSLDAQGANFTFTAVQGRTYRVEASTTLDTWQGVGFQAGSSAPTGAVSDYFIAVNTSVIRLRVPASNLQDGAVKFFRLVVQ